MMSIPWELGLAREPDGLALVQRFAAELAASRRLLLHMEQRRLVSGSTPLAASTEEALEIRVTLRDTVAERCELRLGAGDEGARVRWRGGRLFVERTGTCVVSEHFADLQTAPLPLRDSKVTLHLLVDTASVEVLADEGRVALTSLSFPAVEEIAATLYAEGDGWVERLTVWGLRPAA